MPASRLQRIYLLRGMDRVLYSTPPTWREGTFEQTDANVGRLILHIDGISSFATLQDAIILTDQIAERFRLAISKRTGCPLTLALEKSEEPNFDLPGMVSAHDKVAMSARVSTVVYPREPPEEIEQVTEEAARWILTLTEARNFSGHPDEVFKRLYLLIEELRDEHADHLSDSQRGAMAELKLVRDFVSHSTCNKQGVCSFIAAHLPSAVVSTNPSKVRFDRTNIEHKNFVGRYDPIARAIVNRLLDVAIAALK